MRRKLPTFRSNPELLAKGLWGALGAVVVIALVVVLATRGGDHDQAADDGFFATASVVSHLGEYGTAAGEGLTRPELAAASGTTDTTDGAREVPRGTVDGPGRRVFAGVTVRLPKARQQFVIRQIAPGDLQNGEDSAAFVRWEGWVAVLTPEQVRAGRNAQGLTWQKAGGGLAVPAGATVRLRTMFRLPQSAGRCVGPRLSGSAATASVPGSIDPTATTPAGHRAEETLRGAPAWMIRHPGKDVAWQWLRADAGDLSGQPVAVRSGPVGPVLFRGSNVCQNPQPSVTVAADPDTLSGSTDSKLPFGAPDGY